MKDLIARINELAAKKKQTGLSAVELEEQQHLYRQYIDIIKGRVRDSLDNAGFKAPDPNLQPVNEKGLQIIPESLRKPH